MLAKRIVSVLIIVTLTVSLLGSASCKSRQEKAREKLGQLGIPYDAESFIEAVQKGDKSVVELFIKSGFDVNASKQGITALMMAAMGGHADIVKLLTEVCRFYPHLGDFHL